MAETSGNTIRAIAAELLIRTEGLRTDSVEQHVVIHSLIVNGSPVKNSIAEKAISVAPTEKQRATVVVVMGLVIAAVQRNEIEGQIAAETQLESVLPVVVTLARAIDLAAREIAAR